MFRYRAGKRHAGAGSGDFGQPEVLTWNVEEADGGLYAGIWEATPGKWRIVYDEWEFCHILTGVSIITEDGGEARTVRAGDKRSLRLEGRVPSEARRVGLLRQRGAPFSS
jgi:uncharacterized cupin superfamily protein